MRGILSFFSVICLLLLGVALDKKYKPKKMWKKLIRLLNPHVLGIIF